MKPASPPLARKPRAVRVELPGGAALTRAKDDPAGPVTCSRCGAQSQPDPVRDLEAFEAFAEMHKGAACRPAPRTR